MKFLDLRAILERQELANSKHVGYHCSQKPITKHDSMAGFMSLLNTDYGGEWYARILSTIGSEEAEALINEEPENLDSKQGRLWCDKAIQMIADNDLRLLFVSDEPDKDYGEYCYSVSFPRGSKLHTFTDYNVPGATAYVFKASIVPRFSYQKVQ